MIYGYDLGYGYDCNAFCFHHCIVTSLLSNIYYGHLEVEFLLALRVTLCGDITTEMEMERFRLPPLQSAGGAVQRGFATGERGEEKRRKGTRQKAASDG